MNKPVNIYVLQRLLAPFLGGADNDDEVASYRNVDTNNEQQIKSIFEQTVRPFVDSLTTEDRTRVSDNLSYFLTLGGSDLSWLFDSILPPFSAPRDVRLFFIWLWETLFPNRSWTRDDLAEIARIDDHKERLFHEEHQRIRTS